MISVLLAGLLLPGLGHVVLRRFRRAWLWFLVLLACPALATAVTPWALLATPVLLLVILVDAGQLAWRARRVAGTAGSGAASRPGDDGFEAADDDEPDEDGYVARTAVHRPAVPLHQRRWLRALLLLFALVATRVALRRQVIEIFTLPSASMSPALEIGDRVIADKLSLRWRPPARGEVIAFGRPRAPAATSNSEISRTT